MVKALDNAYLQRLRQLTGDQLRSQFPNSSENAGRTLYNGSPSRDEGSFVADTGLYTSGRERRKRKINYAEDQVDWEFEKLLDNDIGDRPLPLTTNQPAQGQLGAQNQPVTVRALNNVKVIRKTAHVRLTKSEMRRVAQLEEELVPLRLNLNLVGYHYEDKILWNLNDPTLTTGQFARLLCDDLSLPLQPWTSLITAQLERQIMIAQQRKTAWEQKGKETVRRLMKERGEGELRVLIKLELFLGDREYLDYFEWDLVNMLSCGALKVEDFAKNLAAELFLSGEWVTNMAHDIYEQLYVYRHVLSAYPESDASQLILNSFNVKLQSGLRGPGPGLAIDDELLPTPFSPLYRQLTPEEQLASLEHLQSKLANDPLWIDLANETTSWAKLGQSHNMYHSQNSANSLSTITSSSASRRESRRLVSNRYQSSSIKFGEW